MDMPRKVRKVAEYLGSWGVVEGWAACFMISTAFWLVGWVAGWLIGRDTRLDDCTEGRAGELFCLAREKEGSWKGAERITVMIPTISCVLMLDSGLLVFLQGVGRGAN